jgi:hypothetical protein
VQFARRGRRSKIATFHSSRSNNTGPFGGKINSSSIIIKLSLQKAEHKVTLRERACTTTVSGEFGVFWVAKFAPVRCNLSQGHNNLHTIWLLAYSSFHQASIISRANRKDRDPQSGLGTTTSDLASPLLIPVPTQQADLEARTSWRVAPIKPALTFFYPQPATKSTSPGKVGTDTSNSRSRRRAREPVRYKWEEKRDLEPRSLRKGGNGGRDCRPF